MMCRGCGYKARCLGQETKPRPRLGSAVHLWIGLTLGQCVHLVEFLPPSGDRQKPRIGCSARGYLKRALRRHFIKTKQNKKVGRWDTPPSSKDCNPTVTLVLEVEGREGSWGHRKSPTKLGQWQGWVCLSKWLLRGPQGPSH